MTRIMYFIVVALAAAGCTQGGLSPSGQSRQSIGLQAIQPVDALIPWGEGEKDVSLRPGGNEAPAEGPWSIAVTTEGNVLVLDALGGKILEVRPSGETEVAAAAPRLASDLAAGPDGALAVWSMARGQVYVISGGLQRAMDVPKALRNLRGIEIAGSKVVTLQSAYQERFILGSPSAPVGWPQILYTKREGEYRWDDARGLQVILDDESHPVLGAVKNRLPGQEPKEDAWTTLWDLGRPVSAARIVGTNKGGIVCLKLEKLESGGPIGVARSLWCGRPESKSVLLNEQLPAPGQFTPLREAVLSWELPVVAVMWEEAGGLRVKTYVLGAEGEVAP